MVGRYPRQGTHFTENASRMTRAANSIATISLVVMTMALAGGCASWSNKNQAIVQVEVSQNPEKARAADCLRVSRR